MPASQCGAGVGSGAAQHGRPAEPGRAARRGGAKLRKAKRRGGGEAEGRLSRWASMKVEPSSFPLGSAVFLCLPLWCVSPLVSACHCLPCGASGFGGHFRHAVVRRDGWRCVHGALSDMKRPDPETGPGGVQSLEGAFSVAIRLSMAALPLCRVLGVCGFAVSRWRLVGTHWREVPSWWHTRAGSGLPGSVAIRIRICIRVSSRKTSFLVRTVWDCLRCRETEARCAPCLQPSGLRWLGVPASGLIAPRRCTGLRLWLAAPQPIPCR